MARKMTIPTIAVAMLTATAGSPALFAQSPPVPCTSVEHRQFDFWVGEWEVTAGGKPAGRNRIEKILGGCVLMEHWQGAGGSTGKSFNMFYARDGKWHQTWVDGQGGRLDLAGACDAEQKAMSMAGTTPGRKEGVVVVLVLASYSMMVALQRSESPVSKSSANRTGTTASAWNSATAPLSSA